VPVLALSDLLIERDLREAVVKIDVEGFGAEVIGGLMPALDRVRAIVLEVVQPEVERRVP
jgi:FkbM family methyltransferase